MNKEIENVQVGIRIPSHLKVAIEKLATAGHRNFSNEIRLALENHIKAAKVKA